MNTNKLTKPLLLSLTLLAIAAPALGMEKEISNLAIEKTEQSEGHFKPETNELIEEISHIITPEESRKRNQLENRSVSLIYYPVALGPLGHTKIQDHRLAYWCAYTSDNTVSLFDDLISKAEKGGKPFVRFVFRVNAKTKTKDVIDYLDTTAFNCAHFTAQNLHDLNLASIPFPLNYSPLLSATYLSLGHAIGANEVSSIECYGPDLTKFLAIGTILESATILFVAYGFTQDFTSICLLWVAPVLLLSNVKPENVKPEKIKQSMASMVKAPLQKLSEIKESYCTIQ